MNFEEMGSNVRNWDDSIHDRIIVRILVKAPLNHWAPEAHGVRYFSPCNRHLDLYEGLGLVGRTILDWILRK
jgi:hypothetical protein